MARWSPQNNIGKKEAIGRQIFEEVHLKGAEGQPEFGGLQMNHFLEKRGNNVSVDRLGRSNIEKPVKNHIKERAEMSAQSRQSPVHLVGWAITSAENITSYKELNLQLLADPVMDEPPRDNPYHAHIVRPDDISPVQMALNLRHIFEHPPKIEPAEIKMPKSSRWLGMIMIANFIARAKQIVTRHPTPQK